MGFMDKVESFIMRSTWIDAIPETLTAIISGPMGCTKSSYNDIAWTGGAEGASPSSASSPSSTSSQYSSIDPQQICSDLKNRELANQSEANLTDKTDWEYRIEQDFRACKDGCERIRSHTPDEDDQFEHDVAKHRCICAMNTNVNSSAKYFRCFVTRGERIE